VPRRVAVRTCRRTHFEFLDPVQSEPLALIVHTTPPIDSRVGQKDIGIPRDIFELSDDPGLLARQRFLNRTRDLGGTLAFPIILQDWIQEGINLGVDEFASKS
jgi:hypothetical protein